MSWPIVSDYFEAIQNPRIVFSDPELKTGTVRENQLGLPFANTGAFASVYQLNCPGRKWAVRCFLKEVGDQQRRYRAISDHLRSSNLPYTVEFDYLPQGIRVHGGWYPILKMEWIEGEPIDDYIERYLTQPKRLQELARQWIELIAGLKRAGIAHGDLQHGNVLVAHDGLKLIDYDGMYVPALSGLGSHEEGHRNYQHPRRTGRDYDLTLDNFSAWVFFVSISAVSIEPRLWQLLNCGDESLLFRREDYQQPTSSRALQALESSGRTELQVLAAHFRSLLYLPLSKIPSLDGTAVIQGTEAQSSITSAPITGVPDWVNSHRTVDPAEPLITEESTAQPQEQTVPSADWIFDHILTEEPVPAILDTRSLRLERLIVLMSIALSAASITSTFLWAFLMKMWESVVIAMSVQLLMVGLLWRRYHVLQIVKTKKLAAQRVSQGRKTIQRDEVAIKLMQAEIASSMEPLIKLDQEYRAAPIRLNAHIQKIEKTFEGLVAEIIQRRSHLDRRESEDLRAADDRRQGTVTNLVRQLNALEQAEREEGARLYNELQKRHIAQALSSTWLATADVSGVGSKLKARLVDHGISTAADIDWRVRQVPGIGEAKANALVIWRLQVQQQAKNTAPPGLPSHEASRIHSKYEGQRQALEIQISTTRNNTQDRVSILGRFNQSRRQLEEEEKNRRSHHQRELDALRADSKHRQEYLKQEFNEKKSQSEASRKRFETQIADLSKTIFQQRLDLHHSEREAQRYAKVSFSYYVMRVVGLRRSA